jgi:hypothetical protein
MRRCLFASSCSLASHTNSVVLVHLLLQQREVAHQELQARFADSEAQNKRLLTLLETENNLGQEVHCDTT